LSVGKSADVTHTMCKNYLLSIPSLSLCSRCDIPHEMVVAKQCRYDIFIVPAIKNNNIAVFIYVTLLYSAVRCEDLAAEES